MWVYPVPNYGTFRVRFNNQPGEGATVNVFNAAGQNVYQRSLVTGSTTYTEIEVVLTQSQRRLYGTGSERQR